jgi:hypothetical protein
MKNFAQSIFCSLCLMGLLSTSALAKGEITVEQANGDVETYSEVAISNTADILYFKAQDSNTLLMVTKKECTTEDKILVCNQARMGVDTDGVLEELDVKQIVLFINPTAERQPIKGSKVSLGPGTVLLEAATTKGTFITGLGKIDATTKPTGASQ